MDKDFRKHYENRVLPFYQSGHFGEFAGAEGIKILYTSFKKKDSSAALLLLPGKTETYLKYAEFFYDLQDLPLSLYAMDNRGMGFSGRMLPDPMKVHVECFDNYLEDVRIFLNTVVASDQPERLYILGHSTGALIASLYMQTYPEVFQAGILCSPFYQLSVGPVPGFILRALTRLLDRPGRQQDYGPGQKDLKRTDYQHNTITHSHARWSLWEQEIIPNNVAIRFGGVTNHWLRECLIAGVRAVKGAGKITVPLLLLQAEEDSITAAAAQDRFCRRARNCRKVVINGARHEILIERDDLRNEAIDRIKSFIIQQLREA